MKNKEKRQDKIAVNQAWYQLYKRLEKDRLLPDKTDFSAQHRKAATLRWISIAAALAACIIASWFLMQKPNLPDETMLALYNEAGAPTLATMLEDGSVVYLSTQTSLKYPRHFDDSKREVTLQGDAFFEIKKHVQRPFIIHTDRVSVEVTGTSFQINCERDAPFLLSVREGEVKVTQKKHSQSLTVRAGESVSLDTEQLQLKKSTAVFDDYFNYILFKDEDLAVVAAIINAHSDSLQLQVDPAINKRITMTFIANSNIIDVTEAICNVMNIQYVQQGHIIFIQPK